MRGQKSMGAITLVVDMARAFEQVQLNVVRKWATYCDLPQRVLRGKLAHERGVIIENNVSQPMVTVTAISLGSKWSVLLSRNVLQATKCAFF